ncbi:hypothetical protein Pmani_010825 [Petrolisthes manimaculis]|uniref:Tetraspanin n=1 Tax=Petrolisthes manimaculis TaxID=1843537 RepID=A0AAE1Q3M8_9EUCA|nr:hypothetical protein Pmani_010825 [Petrolisthes manimaculis]
MATSNLGCGPLTVKYLVFIFNFIFFLSGWALIVLGGVAQGFFGSYIQFFNDQYETPAIGIIILGAIVVVISFFGCCGAKKENVYMLRIFAFLMIVVLLLEFAAAITVVLLRPDIKKLVKKNMGESMDQYGEPKDLVTKTWDDMQHKYECCGTMNYTDWKNTTYGVNVTGVPDSCCIHETPNCGKNIFLDESEVTTVAPPSNIHMNGCYQSLSDAAHSSLGAIIGGVIILAILQIIGVWMSCCLIRAVKERYEIL